MQQLVLCFTRSGRLWPPYPRWSVAAEWRARGSACSGPLRPTLLPPPGQSSGSRGATLRARFPHYLRIGNQQVAPGPRTLRAGCVALPLLCPPRFFSRLRPLRSPLRLEHHPNRLPEVQRMTLPLSEYWLASSHNTYLPGRQVGASSSIEMYERALLMGARCVEIDLWNGPQTIRGGGTQEGRQMKVRAMPEMGGEGGARRERAEGGRGKADGKSGEWGGNGEGMRAVRERGGGKLLNRM